MHCPLWPAPFPPLVGGCGLAKAGAATPSVSAPAIVSVVSKRLMVSPSLPCHGACGAFHVSENRRQPATLSETCSPRPARASPNTHCAPKRRLSTFFTLRWRMSTQSGYGWNASPCPGTCRSSCQRARREPCSRTQIARSGVVMRGRCGGRVGPGSRGRRASCARARAARRHRSGANG